MKRLGLLALVALLALSCWDPAFAETWFSGATASGCATDRGGASNTIASGNQRFWCPTSASEQNATFIVKGLAAFTWAGDDTITITISRCAAPGVCQEIDGSPIAGPGSGATGALWSGSYALTASGTTSTGIFEIHGLD